MRPLFLVVHVLLLHSAWMVGRLRMAGVTISRLRKIASVAKRVWTPGRIGPRHSLEERHDQHQQRQRKTSWVTSGNLNAFAMGVVDAAVGQPEGITNRRGDPSLPCKRHRSEVEWV